MSGAKAVDGSSKLSRRLETKNHCLTLIDCESETREQPALITPTTSPIPMGERASHDLIGSSLCEKALEDPSTHGALQQARTDAEQSAQALEHLSDGIRAVKRILERCASDEDDIQESSQKDIQHVHELSSKLYGVLGSDLMALINAADMIREHSKLAFQETSEVVTDLSKAKLQAEESANQAKQASKVGRKLFEENLELKGDIDRLRREKRLLVKEVKTLREEAAETRKFDSWRLLEQHMLGSMAIHEMVMKTPTSPKLNMFKEDDCPGGTSTPNMVEKLTESDDRKLFASPEESETTNGLNDEQTKASGSCTKGSTFGGRMASFRGTFRYRKTAQSCNATPSTQKNPTEATSFKEEIPPVEAEEPEKTDLRSPSRLKTKSPIPSLGEVSSYTDEDSATKTHKNVESGTQSDIPDGIEQPSDTFFHIAFNTIDVSPLMTPIEYLDNIVAQDYKPICDPNILRTLAIPSTEQPCVGYKDPSPRKRVSESLFEC
jgi:hypothetical protein